MPLPKNPFAVPKHLKTHNEAKDVKKPVKEALTLHGWFWWMPPANQYGRSGLSDIHAVKKGMFMVVETKYGRNDPTPLQMAFITSVRAERHFAFVVRETTIKSFKSFLLHLDLSLEHAEKEQPIPPEVGAAMLDAINEMAQVEILDASKFNKEAERRQSHVRAVDDQEVLGAGRRAGDAARPPGDVHGDGAGGRRRGGRQHR